ncbi:MAG: DUF362 domain-containing protein [Lachnospiraceae bacterium]|nr:DUF362 domain-containing protein [Lachnospiraceae bacterium]
MSKVYFIPVLTIYDTERITKATKVLLEKLKEDSGIVLDDVTPIKVHFGEKGNITYIGAENYDGIIDFIKENGSEPAYIETNVLYKGERMTRDSHIKLAVEHGFTQAPVIIADGDHGESYTEVEINKKNFRTCKIGREFEKYKKMIVVSHFKGHGVAGFGGAIKQLAMGCAARGGKLAQHDNTIPTVFSEKCVGCKVCANNCPVKAITVDPTAVIDESKCVGCAACMNYCKFDAIGNDWDNSNKGSFNERIAEYAYAAASGKENMYISLALNITKHCDCEGHAMDTIAPDYGIFASLDPVAIDKACLDMVNRKKMVFKKGEYTLSYGKEIGLGDTEYELIELSL